MVTPATREQLHRVQDNAGLLALLLMQHSSIDTVRIANDTRDWEISGDTWIGLPFRLTLPQDVAGQPSQAVIEVDNVGRDITDELEKLPPGASLQATVRWVSRARPTVVDYEFTAPLSSVSATTPSVRATIGNDDVLNAAAIKVRFDPGLAPGLFAG